MIEDLVVGVVEEKHLKPDQLIDIHRCCTLAYQENLDPLFVTFKNPTHVLGYLGKSLVSHAMWVTRWLQPGNDPCLRTAYIEMVATDPHFQGRGFATRIMRRVAEEISNYELGGLCPAEPELYWRLGWSFWRGPLFIRTQEEMVTSPDERVMILRLPKTPNLDLDLPLSAEWREGELW